MAVNKLFIFINVFIQFENPCTTLHYLVWSHFLCSLRFKPVTLALISPCTAAHHYSEKCNTSVATRWWLFSWWPVLITNTRHHIIHSVQCILNNDRYTFIPLHVKDTHITGRKGVFGALLWLTSDPPGEFGLFACFLCPLLVRSRLCPTLSARRIQNQHAYSSWAEESPQNCDWLSEGETSLCQRGLTGCPESQRVCVGVWV